MTEPPLSVALSELDATALIQLDDTSFLIADREVELHCRLKLLPEADRLFVMFSGAVDRSKPLPVFARWNWGKVLGGHVLSVCDPTLFLDDQLRLGWFVGNRTLDPMGALVRIVDRVRALTRIGEGRVIFYGSSGGGFAALLAAASLPHGRAIAINPQSEIINYYPRAVADVARVFAKGWTPARCRDAYPLRWSALAAVAEANRAQRDLRIVYAQNLIDKWHHARHYIPFCAQTGASASGGLSRDGRIRTHVFSSPEGHGAEPAEVVKFILAEGLPHLLQTADRADARTVEASK